jgi:hypothetical protein
MIFNFCSTILWEGLLKYFWHRQFVFILISYFFVVSNINYNSNWFIYYLQKFCFFFLFLLYLCLRLIKINKVHYYFFIFIKFYLFFVLAKAVYLEFVTKKDIFVLIFYYSLHFIIKLLFTIISIFQRFFLRNFMHLCWLMDIIYVASHYYNFMNQR